MKNRNLFTAVISLGILTACGGSGDNNNMDISDKHIDRSENHSNQIIGRAPSDNAPTASSSRSGKSYNLFGSINSGSG
ncbi:MAG: hypothetical protein Q4A74_08610, partial [Cardiobacteriaceae bacterium]|nr:hypothetical protein [Cardiobacteriaceae bacterium]